LQPAGAAATLQARKQEFIRNEIWNAAIDLFAEKGFDETTVEDISQTAGVSRRSFFRYFSSKNDLMAQGIVSYGAALAGAVSSFPACSTPMDVLRETVLQIAGQAAAYPRARKIMEIASKYPAAREAQRSRMAEVEDQVTEAYARRIRQQRTGSLTPRIMAGLTILTMELTLRSWFEDSRRDIPEIMEQVLAGFRQVLWEETVQNDLKGRKRK
jgi:AcrR family transcriptional regulator